MTVVWNQIEDLSAHIKTAFEASGYKLADPVDDYDWENHLYGSRKYRRAHLQIIDRRETHKIYILHATIFPHFNDPSPIWGFDAVCGPNKITGAFHDFSFAGDKASPMWNWFNEKVSTLEWNKPRELPEWAKQIFSPAMVAAGNLSDTDEITQLCDLARNTLEFYLNNVGLNQQDIADFHMAQNRYCRYQKQNPHVVRSMVSMGVEEPKIKRFVETVQYPEIG